MTATAWLSWKARTRWRTLLAVAALGAAELAIYVSRCIG